MDLSRFLGKFDIQIGYKRWTFTSTSSYVIQGRYPKSLLSLWDAYNDAKGSENIRPGRYIQTHHLFKFNDCVILQARSWIHKHTPLFSCLMEDLIWRHFHSVLILRLLLGNKRVVYSGKLLEVFLLPRKFCNLR